MDAPDPTEVARILRALVTAVDAGVITAETRKEQGMVRQLRGAAVAMEALIAEQENIDHIE
jgi:hypothetical protein